MSDDVPSPPDPNTGLIPAPILPPERFVSDDTAEVFEFDVEVEEELSTLYEMAFPEAATFADNAEDIDFIYPSLDV
uniref:Uncharacterized protein n=1 Tax=Panagrolaimus superbus TaxID=310955 RepID=A0A914YPL8_9BILA